jgi:hypothetical protein
MALRTFTAVVLTSVATATFLPSAVYAVGSNGEAVVVSKEFSVEFNDGSEHTFILRTGQRKSSHGAGAFGHNHIRYRAKSTDPETAEIHRDALSVMDTEWANALRGNGTARRGRSGHTSYVYSSEFVRGDGWIRKLCVIVGDGDLVYDKVNYGPVGIISAFAKDVDKEC